MPESTCRDLVQILIEKGYLVQKHEDSNVYDFYERPEYAKQKYTPTEIIKEIGEKEGEYIRAYRPALNYQIPKASDWTKFDVNPKAHTITFTELLDKQN